MMRLAGGFFPIFCWSLGFTPEFIRHQLVNITGPGNGCLYIQLRPSLLPKKQDISFLYQINKLVFSKAGSLIQIV